MREVIAQKLCANDGLKCFAMFEGKPLWMQYEDEAQAALDAISEAGFVIVPKEPTHDMTEPVVPAGEDRTPVLKIWRAMIEASQDPGA